MTETTGSGQWVSRLKNKAGVQMQVLVPQGLTSWTLVTFRSLKNANYRNYAIAQLVSRCGSWIQLTAISWLVFDITNSPLDLGLVSFLRQSPIIFFGFLGGWVADHFDRRRILITTKVI
ncbi:MAG TPA: MFS transporter, partial [Candidatus Melainabacteria bacterium]|nr:MFS transporter [Candidatus Melainabacteria bacterium]